MVSGKVKITVYGLEFRMEQEVRFVLSDLNKEKLWYRSRGLDRMEERFGRNSITHFIKKRLKTEKVVRVLEVGFGEGKCLLELRDLFPNKKIELYGINNVRKGNMHKRNDFLKNAKKFGILTLQPLPKPYFYDAGEGLRFKSNYFDVVISQVSFHYVGNKARLLEEIWRVLKPRGKAFLHVDGKSSQDYPDFMKWNTETPRFIIYRDQKMIKLSSYLKRMKNKGYDISLRNSFNKKDHRIILMTKNNSRKLNLNLEYDGNSTLLLTNLKGTDGYKMDGSVWWGTRSVFTIGKRK